MTRKWWCTFWFRDLSAGSGCVVGWMWHESDGYTFSFVWNALNGNYISMTSFYFVQFSEQWSEARAHGELVKRDFAFFISLHIDWWGLYVVTDVCTVMCTLHLLLSDSLDFTCWISACLGWLVLETICPPAMEVQRAPGEGEPGQEVPRAVKEYTNSRWLREPGQWLYIILNKPNRTASLSTALCSSSVRTMSSGNTPKE